MDAMIINCGTASGAEIKKEVIALLCAKLGMISRDHRVLEDNIACRAPANIDNRFLQGDLLLAVDNQVGVYGNRLLPRAAMAPVEGRSFRVEKRLGVADFYFYRINVKL